LLDDDELTLLTGALEFETLTARDVAIPPAELRVVPRDVTVGELQGLCASTGFSRFPMRDDAGSLAGYVHVKDLLQTGTGELDRPVTADLVHPLMTVPADAPLRRVVRLMQRHNAHLAVLDDDDGAQPRVVALEDVLEELVGEVRDATTPRTTDTGR
ncbi:CBS domain-containing protein, partial [Georgenia sp. 10Sc9-8]|nr:CBS domain-containing protein [Georgenia halotolerans]